jgi:hypothetical protein
MKLTKKQRAAFAITSSIGGFALAAKRTKKERVAAAAKAIKARWAKRDATLSPEEIAVIRARSARRATWGKKKP